MVFTLQSVEIGKLVSCVYDFATEVCTDIQYIVLFCMLFRPQLMAMLDIHSPLIEPKSSWVLVGFVNH